MKLTVSAYDDFAKCQRMFFHKHVNETCVDSDFVAPVYFAFGTVAHECLAKFQYDGTKMSLEFIKESCKKHGILDEFEQMRVAVALRSYFAEWPKTEIVATEVWFETGSLKGRIDAIARTENGLVILCDEFHSSISPSLSAELPVDMQICGYAGALGELAKKLGVPGDSFVGVQARFVQKNSQVIREYKEFKTKPPQQAETPLEFLARANNGKTWEWSATFDELDVAGAEQRIAVLTLDLAMKENVEDYEQNKGEDNRNCVLNPSKEIACQFYSQCHGVQYSKRNEPTEEEIW
jgi:hypothetical protein